MEEELSHLKKISHFFKKMNSKIILLQLINKAKEEYDSYDYQSSYKSLYSAYKIEPHNATILRGLGCMRQFKGNYKSAIFLYQQALKYSENKEIEYTLIGMVYYLQEKLDEAITNFNKAIDLNEQYEQAYEGRNQSMLENHVNILDLQESLKKYF